VTSPRTTSPRTTSTPDTGTGAAGTTRTRGRGARPAGAPPVVRPPAVTATIQLAGEVRAEHGSTAPAGTTPGFLTVVLGPLLVQCHDRVATVSALSLWRRAARCADVLPEVVWAPVAPDDEGLFTATGSARMTVALTLAGTLPGTVRERTAEESPDGRAHVQVGIAGVNVLVADRVALRRATAAWHAALEKVDHAFPLLGGPRG